MRPKTREEKKTADLEKQIADYLAAGGKIRKVPQGVIAESPEGKKWNRDNFSINGVDGKKRFKKDG
jgi:hypothetical protein